MLRRLAPLFQKAAILDIDGVFIRGDTNIEGSGAALQKLTNNDIPWVMLTNGSGTEGKKAESVSEIIGFKVPTERVIVSHTPLEGMKELKEQRILISGTQSGVEAIQAYGFKNAVWSEDHMHKFPKNTPHKWRAGSTPSEDRNASLSPPCEETLFNAVFVVGEPIDWHSELQLITDTLLTDPVTGERTNSQSVPLYWFNDDILFAGDHPHPRLAGGAFYECINAVFKAITGTDTDLEVRRYGKPHPVQYQYALEQLRKQHKDISKIYCVGDNLLSDIKGANQSGDMFHSVLVLSGVTDQENASSAKQLLAPSLTFSNISTFVEDLLSESPSTSKLSFKVISGPDCPLCEEGIIALEDTLTEMGIKEPSISVEMLSDLPAAEADKHRLRIPVFSVNGKELCYGKVAAGDLKFQIEKCSSA